jgi:hypothetical protein
VFLPRFSSALLFSSHTRKEVVLTKEKLTQAIKAGYLPPRLYARAVKREEAGWNVSLKIVDTPESEPEWDSAE